MPRHKPVLRFALLALGAALAVTVWPQAPARLVAAPGTGEGIARAAGTAPPAHRDPLAPAIRTDVRVDAWAEPGTVRPPSPAVLDGYRWPLAHGRITLPFGPSPWGSRVVDGRLFHDGMDIASFCGDRVVAAHDGVVLAAGRRFDRFMGWQGDLGPYVARLDEKHAWQILPIMVVVDDGNGYRSLYAHFERVVVKAGQRVRAGQLLGYEGRTGRASGCHVHYGLFSPLEDRVFEISAKVVTTLKVPRFQTARIDPLLVLPPREPSPSPAPVRSSTPRAGSGGQ